MQINTTQQDNGKQDHKIKIKQKILEPWVVQDISDKYQLHPTKDWNDQFSQDLHRTLLNQEFQDTKRIGQFLGVTVLGLVGLAVSFTVVGLIAGSIIGIVLGGYAGKRIKRKKQRNKSLIHFDLFMVNCACYYAVLLDEIQRNKGNIKLNNFRYKIQRTFKEYRGVEIYNRLTTSRQKGFKSELIRLVKVLQSVDAQKSMYLSYKMTKNMLKDQKIQPKEDQIYDIQYMLLVVIRPAILIFRICYSSLNETQKTLLLKFEKLSLTYEAIQLQENIPEDLKFDTDEFLESLEKEINIQEYKQYFQEFKLDQAIEQNQRELNEQGGNNKKEPNKLIHLFQAQMEMVEQQSAKKKCQNNPKTGNTSQRKDSSDCSVDDSDNNSMSSQEIPQLSREISLSNNFDQIKGIQVKQQQSSFHYNLQQHKKQNINNGNQQQLQLDNVEIDIENEKAENSFIKNRSGNDEVLNQDDIDDKVLENQLNLYNQQSNQFDGSKDYNNNSNGQFLKSRQQSMSNNAQQKLKFEQVNKNYGQNPEFLELDECASNYDQNKQHNIKDAGYKEKSFYRNFRGSEFVKHNTTKLEYYPDKVKRFSIKAGNENYNMKKQSLEIQQEQNEEEEDASHGNIVVGELQKEEYSQEGSQYNRPTSISKKESPNCQQNIGDQAVPSNRNLDSRKESIKSIKSNKSSATQHGQQQQQQQQQDQQSYRKIQQQNNNNSIISKKDSKKTMSHCKDDQDQPEEINIKAQNHLVKFEDQELKGKLDKLLSIYNETIEEGRWEKVMEKEMIQIYKKQNLESAAVMVRANAILKNSKKEDIFKQIYYTEHRCKWDNIIKGLKQVEQIDENSDIIYSYIDAGFGTTKRDWIQKRFYKNDFPQKGLTTICYFSSEHPQYPPKKGFIRADSFISGYIMQDLGNDAKLFMLSCNDIKGLIPKYIVNYGAQKAPKDWISGLQKAINKSYGR